MPSPVIPFDGKICMDIQSMPNFNDEVTNGIKSVSKGFVVPVSGSPHCHVHGAMNKVSKFGIWRCLQPGCGVGCFVEDQQQFYNRLISSYEFIKFTRDNALEILRTFLEKENS